MVVLVENGALAGVFAFLILVFIPFPYVIYIHENLWKDDRNLHRIPIFLSLFNFILVVGLAYLGIMDLKESVIFTHLIWGISFIYVGAAVVNVVKTNIETKDKMAIANAAAMLILVGVSVADIYLFWTGGSIQNDVFGRALVLFYFVFLAHINVIATIKEFDKARKADFYKELANTDSITKINNRTAFNHDIEKLSNENEYCIISMDLNNLKQVNDTKGHQAGDRYILNAANIIKDIFEQFGKCYRIGGDEFSVIIINDDCTAIAKDLTDKMENEITKHNNDNPEDPVDIAWGYEVKMPGDLRNFNEILFSADEKMYENKRYKKGMDIR